VLLCGQVGTAEEVGFLKALGVDRIKSGAQSGLE
jgi:hypothetical protein